MRRRLRLRFVFISIPFCFYFPFRPVTGDRRDSRRENNEESCRIQSARDRTDFCRCLCARALGASIQTKRRDETLLCFVLMVALTCNRTIAYIYCTLCEFKFASGIGTPHSAYKWQNGCVMGQWPCARHVILELGYWFL